jgi:recombinational DNA repair ATPase RecF
MTPKTRDKECTAFRYKAGGAVADVEKKRKLFNCSEHYIRIKQIKSALAAVVAEIDPKDATTSEVFGHLTKAHGAVKAASSLLAGNSRVQRTLTDKSDFDCQPTMLERANIFHHWHASRTAQICQTDEICQK